MTVDNLTRKILLTYAKSFDAEVVVNALVVWRAHNELGNYLLLVTDRGSHFNNIVLKKLAETHILCHRFSIANAH